MVHLKMVMTERRDTLDSKPYLLKRMVRPDQIKKRFIPERRNMLINITRYNRKYTFYSMREARRVLRSVPSLNIIRTGPIEGSLESSAFSWTVLN